MLGTLYIVSTPIGNLKDVTLRALEALNNVDLIAAEDTRKSSILTRHYGIKTPLTSFYEFNKIKKAEVLISELKNGKSIALISEAGTPGISDPGFNIIKLAIFGNIPIVVIPGANAILPALVVSGFSTSKFVFEGFLSNKSAKRIKRLKELADEKRTIILYESPHRLLKLLEDMNSVFGDINISVIRELTKKFEEIKRDKISGLLAHFKKNHPRGEFVIVFSLC